MKTLARVSLLVCLRADAFTARRFARISSPKHPSETNNLTAALAEISGCRLFYPELFAPGQRIVSQLTGVR